MPILDVAGIEGTGKAQAVEAARQILLPEADFTITDRLLSLDACIRSECGTVRVGQLTEAVPGGMVTHPIDPLDKGSVAAVALITAAPYVIRERRMQAGLGASVDLEEICEQLAYERIMAGRAAETWGVALYEIENQTRWKATENLSRLIEIYVSGRVLLSW